LKHLCFENNPTILAQGKACDVFYCGPVLLKKTSAIPIMRKTLPVTRNQYGSFTKNEMAVMRAPLPAIPIPTPRNLRLRMSVISFSCKTAGKNQLNQLMNDFSLSGLGGGW
jgi:hypothetical protein